MRERLSCVVELRRFGVWRAAVCAVAATAIAAMAAWGGLALATGASGSALIAAIAAAMAIMSALLAVSLARVEPGTLASGEDGWTFTSRRGGVERVESGALTVAVDVGTFLLLTLVRGDGSRRWLPVQRRGLASDWHALRCAVHAPRPAAVAAAAHEPLAE